MALGFNAEGGTRNFRFATAATHSALHEAMVVVRGTRRPSDGFFLRAESFYNVATEVDRLDAICPLLPAYGGKSLHAQSHGESFWSLVMHRFHGDALYLLDEPEAALSPTRQLALLARLHALAGRRRAVPDCDAFAPAHGLSGRGYLDAFGRGDAADAL